VVVREFSRCFPYVQEEVMKAFYELNEALKKYTLTEVQIQRVTNMFLFTFRNYITKKEIRYRGSREGKKVKCY
jgi:hypothetical protein